MEGAGPEVLRAGFARFAAFTRTLDLPPGVQQTEVRDAAAAGRRYYLAKFAEEAWRRGSADTEAHPWRIAPGAWFDVHIELQAHPLVGSLLLKLHHETHPYLTRADFLKLVRPQDADAYTQRKHGFWLALDSLPDPWERGPEYWLQVATAKLPQDEATGSEIKVAITRAIASITTTVDCALASLPER
jgi:hypothetical protein